LLHQEFQQKKDKQKSLGWILFGYALILFLTTGLCLTYSAYQVSEKHSPGFSALAAVIRLIVIGTPVFGLWKVSTELEEKEMKLKDGSFFLDFKHEKRLFSICFAFEKIITAFLLGSIVQ
jgi:hypothetical protein